MAPPTYDPKTPLHVQVREMIRRQTESGDLIDENGRLKTEAELVEHFGVSRVTIRSAINPLVADGMFDRTPGRGTFLRTNQPERWIGRLMGFQETIAAAGHVPGARILAQGMINDHDDDVRETLGERAVWHLRRIRFADDIPIAIEHAFYPPDIGLDLEGRDLISIQMYSVFEHELDLTIGTSVQTISAKLSTEDEQLALELTEMTALIQMRRFTIASEGRPLELLRAVYHPDYYKLSIELDRRQFGLQA